MVYPISFQVSPARYHDREHCICEEFSASLLLRDGLYAVVPLHPIPMFMWSLPKPFHHIVKERDFVLRMFVGTAPRTPPQRE